MILGIDPWFRKLWYAIIDNNLNIIDGGILLSEKKLMNDDKSWDNNLDMIKNPSIQIYSNQNPNRQRVHDVYIYFANLIKENDIKTVVMEKLFFMEANKNNAERVYAVRWVLINLFMTHGIKTIELTPIQVKKYITWNGKAGKLLVQNIIQKIYKLEDMPEFNDTADALWLAYIGTKLR